MDEEHAIFVIGKQLSALRNSGENLSEDLVQVGNSWISPTELADEYDRHFPPGQRKHKQVTDRIFEYKNVPSRDCRGELMGLYMSHQGRSFDVLEKAEVFPCNDNQSIETKIWTSRCNRYDVIEGRLYTFVIDKLEEKISVAKAEFRVDDLTFCEEKPIAGRERVRIGGDKSGQSCVTDFPFFTFDKFRAAWKGYVELRKQQIAELREQD